jgi:hypothetical protein
VLALPLAAGWLNATFVALTMSGWWFPGRQLIVVLPCVVIAVAWWAGQREERVRYLAIGAAFGASVFLWFVVEGVVGSLTMVVGFQSMTYPLVNAWRFLLPDYRAGTPFDWVKHACWLAALTVFGVRYAHLRLVPERVRRVVRTRHQPSGALVDA